MENVCSYMTFYDLREKYPLTFFVLSGKITREKRGRSVLDCIGLGDSRVFGSSEGSRKSGGVRLRKVSPAIIQKDCDRLVCPECGNDDVRVAVAIYVTRC